MIKIINIKDKLYAIEVFKSFSPKFFECNNVEGIYICEFTRMFGTNYELVNMHVLPKTNDPFLLKLKMLHSFPKYFNVRDVYDNSYFENYFKDDIKYYKILATTDERFYHISEKMSQELINHYYDQFSIKE